MLGRRRRRRHWPLVAVIVAGVGVALGLSLSLPANTGNAPPEPQRKPVIIPLGLPDRAASAQLPAPAESGSAETWHELKEALPVPASTTAAPRQLALIAPPPPTAARGQPASPALRTGQAAHAESSTAAHPAPHALCVQAADASSEHDAECGPEASSPEGVAIQETQPVRGEMVVAVPEAGTQETEGSIPSPQRVVVNRGDTLSAIFDRLGLDNQDLYRLLAHKETKRRLSRIRPKQVLEFHRDPQGALEALIYHMDQTQSFRLTRGADGFEPALVREALQVRPAAATGTVESSLFHAGQKAGLSDNLIMQMVEILGWDVDFALDLRSGDHFTVLYDEFFSKKGEKIRDGNILAVDFINQGREIRAVRYTNPSGHTGYYSADGHSMRKAFLRTPVRFSRISSRFSRGRYHPVLNRIRAHKGVDYAASTGTPVNATGDGKVTYKGRKGGYGKTVIIRHGGTYTTLYAHLSRYARGLRPGQRVRQGQVIGFVGKSGLATGPHLHYEFRVKGQHRDPLRVRLPRSLPIEAKHREDFAAKTQPLVARLDTLRTTRLARNER